MEMVVRTMRVHLKRLMRRRMKIIKGSSKRPFRETVVDYFNLAVGASVVSQDETKQYITKYFLPELLEKYPGALSDLETTMVRDGSMVLISKDKELFDRIHELTAIKFSDQSIAELSNPDYFQFVLPDIESMKTRVKRMNMVDYADGMALYFQSMSKCAKKQKKTQERLLKLAQKRLERAHRSSVSILSHQPLLQLATILRLIASKGAPEEADNLLSRAEQCLQSLIASKHRVSRDVIRDAVVSYAKTLHTRYKIGSKHTNKEPTPLTTAIEKLTEVDEYEREKECLFMLGKLSFVLSRLQQRNTEERKKLLTKAEHYLSLSVKPSEATTHRRHPYHYRSVLYLARTLLELAALAKDVSVKSEYIDKSASFFQEAISHNVAWAEKVFSAHINNNNLSQLLLFTSLSTKSSSLAKTFIAYCGSNVTTLAFTERSLESDTAVIELNEQDFCFLTSACRHLSTLRIQNFPLINEAMLTKATEEMGFNITKLKLINFQLTSGLDKILRQCPHLTELTIQNDEPSNAMSESARCITPFNGLVSLRITNLTFNELATFLRVFPNVQKLDISKSSGEISDVSGLLLSNQNLRQLCLQGISSIDNTFLQSLKESGIQLEKLDLFSCGKISYAECSTLPKHLPKLASVRTPSGAVIHFSAQNHIKLCNQTWSFSNLLTFALDGGKVTYRVMNQSFSGGPFLVCLSNERGVVHYGKVESRDAFKVSKMVSMMPKVHCSLPYSESPNELFQLQNGANMTQLLFSLPLFGETYRILGLKEINPSGAFHWRITKDGADIAEWRTLQRNGTGGYITIKPNQNVTLIIALFVSSYILVHK
eukprot:TRINITY_DN119_c0_g1_i2.p1 TRINITY_DN119_c0_g1~~TRINITY_DN119_c0_g1_i2.p1  ORF type:complete len:825 (+),score=199.84 TRINITY_DN119_c0_g1_i2:71-2545(+)